MFERKFKADQLSVLIVDDFSTMRRIIKNMLKDMGFDYTKIDEASNIGTILNLLYHFPITLSYVTTGQNVPDDIELANPNKLANLILRD